MRVSVEQKEHEVIVRGAPSYAPSASEVAIRSAHVVRRDSLVSETVLVFASAREASIALDDMAEKGALGADLLPDDTRYWGGSIDDIVRGLGAGNGQAD